jgi:hypothetical protein
MKVGLIQIGAHALQVSSERARADGFSAAHAAGFTGASASFAVECMLHIAVECRHAFHGGHASHAHAAFGRVSVPAPAAVLVSHAMSFSLP